MEFSALSKADTCPRRPILKRGPVLESPVNETLPLSLLANLLDLLEQPILVSDRTGRSEEHTSELQSQSNLVCRLLLEKKKKTKTLRNHIRKKTNKKYIQK